ncbi:CsgE family curli-type amyloid fiber assembly protein [Lacinutrix neustonica]|uniref:Curli production assembly/transport component CsgE n=1 Tax=Lacinutrix neustonica TaxID=2980107 RepID=A0A9E8MVP2_9FLAO|nr:CsgE family curli-type amyloid fiber assembly protein [Lacinutrix neustonica]WAC01810.1 CsgE family curli-type amyloid fiber assembly protein [Lacinutrix neustonica]
MNSKQTLFILVFLLLSNHGFTQKYFNKEVKAVIKIDQTSEFVTFSATVENLTLSDLSLRYEFTVYKTDTNGNTSNSRQENRFFLKGSDKKVLSSVDINSNLKEKIIILLLVYPISNDEKQGAIGKDRIVVTGNENGVGLNIELSKEREAELKAENNSEDQDMVSNDGVFLEGLVIQKTLTKSGRDFYRYFYSEYYNRQIKTTKNIVIQEVPGQRRSTRISVKIDGQIVRQFFSRPKKEFLKEMAITGLQRSLRYLQQLEKQKETLKRY